MRELFILLLILLNLTIMMLVDKETGKGYVEMKKVHRDKK
jgi:hypothetical protein